MKKIQNQINIEDFINRKPINQINDEVIPIKMEMGNDMKVPFLKTSPCAVKNDDPCSPSSSKCTDSSPKKSMLSFGQEGKSRPFLKKETFLNNNFLREHNSNFKMSQDANILSNKKTLALMKKLHSDLTPQAILPASRGKRIHTSPGSDAASSGRRLKLPQANKLLKSSNASKILIFKQEPSNEESPARSSSKCDLSFSLKNSCNTSQTNENNSEKAQLKSVKFKKEDSVSFKRSNGSSIKRSMNEYSQIPPSKKAKTVAVSSSFSTQNVSSSESFTSMCASTVVSTSCVTSRPRGGGRNREIDSLYNNLKEINWARDKEFTSLLYAKYSVRHSDRNSNIKTAITDRSKKLAKLGKLDKNSTKARIKQLKSQPKLTKIMKPTMAIKPKQKLTISMQKKLKKNIPGEQIHSRQHLKLPVKQKNISLSKRPEMTKNVKSKASSQQLKIFQQKKMRVSKNQDISRKVKSKAMSHQLKMSQKNASSKPPVELSKKVNSKLIFQQSKMPQKTLIPPKSNGILKKEEKEIKVVYQKLKPISLKKKIPIQSVKPIVDYEKKNVLVNVVKNGNAKLPTAASATSWKNVTCDMTSIPSFLSDNSRNPHVLSALHNNPELRVTVTPLESTHPWSSDFNFQNRLQREYDAHNRRLLQEKMHRVYASMDHTHVNSVLQEVHDSIGVFPTTTKLPEEKTKKSVRSSVRQSECAFRYKEIVVKKHDNYLQVVLVPNIQKQNSLTVDAIKELREAFVAAKKDTNCNAVLLSSSGSFFCSGIDLGQLYGSNKKHIAEEMASSLKDLILTLALFPKPVVAAVNGSAVGLGVSLLMYCDIILASDKATFCIPAAKMGYVPEGGVALTLPQVVGSSCAIEMLLHGRRLTAQQALKFGMVSEVLWPTQLMEEVIPRMRSLAEQPLQVMEITKTMVRCHLWEKLPAQLEHEWRLLPTQWLSSECQQNIKKLLQTGWLFEY